MISGDLLWCKDCLVGQPRVRSGLCEFCGRRLELKSFEEMDWDWASLSGPGPLRRVQLSCKLRRFCSHLEMNIKACYAEAGEACSQGDDPASCPYAEWLELDCTGSDADAEGQLVKPEAEELGTEAEGVAELLSDVWSFVDGDDDPYTWAVIRAGRSAHERAHVEWCRESAARFMAQARISTGNCEGPGCAQ